MPIINPLPFTFVNGTIADATQVDANNAQILANVNANAAENGANSSITSLLGLTTPLSVVQGGTGRNTGFTTLTTTLNAFISLNNTALYFDGPTCVQGAAGTWLAIGHVTLVDTGTSAAFNVKLWDGTNVIASTQIVSGGAGQDESVTLAGVFVAPPGNIRMSAQDLSSTNGFIAFNVSGNVTDSSLTVLRIA